MTSDFIIEANELNFEYEVIAYSMNVPVIVDFWAEWCQPCKTLGPNLERAIIEQGGGIRLAKVNTDLNPNLTIQYGVRSIPTVKAFVQGRVVAEFVGSQPPDRIRTFLAKLVPPSPVDLSIEKAANLLYTENWQEAEGLFRDALVSKPNSSSGLLGLSKSLLAQGKSVEALDLLQEFPASKEFSQAEILIPLALNMEDLRNELLPDDSPPDAAFKNALRLVGKGNLEAAMDGLLDILRTDKHFKEGEVHKVSLAILEMFGQENPLTLKYRKELANILF